MSSRVVVSLRFDLFPLFRLSLPVVHPLASVLVIILHVFGAERGNPAHTQNEECCPVAIHNPLTGYEPNQLDNSVYSETYAVIFQK